MVLTKILKPSVKGIITAVHILRKGGIVIYPTESSYAIGCDFTNKKAVAYVVGLKQRPVSKHITVIVDSLKTAKKYCRLNKKEKQLIKEFMPGPLTICAKGKHFKEFNFRISSNRIASALAKFLGKPIVATSANFSNEMPIYESKKLKQFIGLVDAIIDIGMLPKREVSTVVKVNKETKILREGAIPKDKILNKK